MDRKTFEVLKQIHDKKTEGLSDKEKLDLIYEEYKKLVSKEQRDNQINSRIHTNGSNN